MAPKATRSRVTPGPPSTDDSTTSRPHTGRTSRRQASRRAQTAEAEAEVEAEAEEQPSHTGFVVPKQPTPHHEDQTEEEQGVEEPTSGEIADDSAEAAPQPEVAPQPEMAPQPEAARQPEFDADMIISLKDVLFSSADTLFNHLMNFSREPGWIATLKAHQAVFGSIRQYFAPDGSTFLDLGKIQNALKGTDTPDALTLPSVVSAANLAILLDSLQRIASNQPELATLLSQLDREFPWCIIVPESARQDTYKEIGTFERACEIRITRWGLAMVAESEKTVENAARIGCELFLEDAPEATIEALMSPDATLKPVSDFSFKDPDEGDAKAKVIDDIRVFWNSVVGEGGADLQLDEFVVHLAGWTNEFLDEITRWTIGLFQAVKETVTKTRPRIPGAVQETDEVENQLMQETAASQGAPASRGGNKSLYRGGGSIRAVSAATGGRKRKRADDGDGQVTPKNPKRRARRSAAAVITETPRDTETGQEPGPEAGPEAGQEAAVQPAVEGEQQPGGEQPVPGTAPADGEQAVVVHGDEANGDVIYRLPSQEDRDERERNRRMPKKRVFWTPQETQAIIDLVRDYGSYWSGMATQAQKENLFSVPRTQQHIRDKARNIKLDLIRRDQLLPDGFDRVLFSAKEERMLRKLGKNPDRMEADVDNDGHPTNIECEPVD